VTLSERYMEKVYVLFCVGENDCVDGRFSVMCRKAFRENPLGNTAYAHDVAEFIHNCKDTSKYAVCVADGTEKLVVRELELV